MPQIGRTLLQGVAGGIAGLTSIVVFLGFTAFTSFFLLIDGPKMGRWIQRHMGMRPAEARIVLDDIIHALRRYFLGLTIVAAVSTAGVVLGAVIVGLPSGGDDRGRDVRGQLRPDPRCLDRRHLRVRARVGQPGHGGRVIMALIVFLSNGPLQQVVQPIAYGATLQLNPLVVFSLTIAAGTLFGMVGMVLAAPLLSAAVRVSKDLGELRAAPAGQGAGTLGRGRLDLASWRACSCRAPAGHHLRRGRLRVGHRRRGRDDRGA